MVDAIKFNASFATQRYLPEGWLGLVSLRADLADFSRVDRRQVRYLDSHKAELPVGMLERVWFEADPQPDGRYMMDVSLPVIDANKYFREQRDAGMRGDTSVGYRITDIRFVRPGATWDEDEFDAAWVLLEVSDTTIPMDDTGEGRDALPTGDPDGYDASADVVLRTDWGRGYVRREILTRADAARRAHREDLNMKIRIGDREYTREEAAALMRSLTEALVDEEDGVVEIDGSRQSVDDVLYSVRHIAGLLRRADDDDEGDDGDRMGDDHEGRGEGGGMGAEPGSADNNEGSAADTSGASPESGADKEGADSQTSPPEKDMRGEPSQTKRDDDKPRGRSRRFNPNVIIPSLPLSRNKHGDEGMNVGRMIQAAMLGGRHAKAGSRELEVLDEMGIPYSAERMVMPMSFLAKYGRHADAIKKRQDAGEGWRQKPIQAGYFRDEYNVVGPDGRERSVNTNSSGAGAAGAALPVLLDVANSQMWLYETAPVLAAMNPIMGIRGEYKAWYGSTAPTGGFVAEGGSHTETDPALTEITRKPKTIHYPWSVTTAFEAMDAVGVASLFENAVEAQLMNLVTQAMASGQTGGNAGDFARDTNGFLGLLNSGINEASYGAAVTNFDRDDVIDAEQKLRENKAMGSDLNWLLSVAVETQARKTRIGGAEAIVYLAQSTAPYQGRIGGSVLGEGTDYVSTNLLGKGATGAKQTSYIAVGYGSQALPLFFGDGIEFRVFRPTDAAKTSYALLAHVNFALINPKNFEVRHQT